MPKFALLKGGVFADVREQKRQPGDIPHKNVVWLPFEVEKPDYDKTTQVRESPVIVVESTRVIERWVVRDKTAQEMSQETDGQREHELNVLRAALVLGFDHENRIRTLEGRPAVTAAQYRAAVKARL